MKLKNIIKFTLYSIVILSLALFCWQKAEALDDETNMKLIIDYTSFLDPNYLGIDIEINAPVNSYNAVMGVINYDPNFLVIDETLIDNSFCALIVAELPSAYEGKKTIICGNPENNASSTMPLAHIRFKKINAGWTNITLEDSQILTSDGFGKEMICPNEISAVLIEK